MAVENDFAQWVADNERLVLAALQQNDETTPLDYDEVTMEAIKKRCVDRFGEVFGTQYYQILILTLPDRHKKLFPEIYGEEDVQKASK